MERFMRESDVLSWNLERDPVLRATVVFVVWLDRTPSWDTLLAKVDRATCSIPSFRQRVVESPGRWGTPRWEVDPEFDLSWHMRRLGAPSPLPSATVLQVARLEATTGFDRARPLWQFTLIEPDGGGPAALVMKLHHSLTDGVGGMELALRLFDERRTATPDVTVCEPPTAERARAASLAAEQVVWQAVRSTRFAAHQGRSMALSLVHSAGRPDRPAREALETARSIGRTVAPVWSSLSPELKQRGRGRYLDIIDVPLGELKAAAARAGGSVNDGFLGAVTGGLRRYHEHHGQSVGDLRVMMPISIRRPGDPAGGNRITLMRFPLPVGEIDPTRRIPEIERRCRAARHERSLTYTNAIAGALDLLPTAVVGGLFKRVDFLASDVPGFRQRVYLAGAAVQRYVAFGPTTGTAVNTTLVSYRDRCFIGVNVDTAAAGDPELLVRCLREGFDEVLALAPPPPARGRPPATTPGRRGGRSGDAQLRG